MTGIGTVAALEFRLRLQTGRWRWLLGSWFVVLALIAMLIRLAVREDVVGSEVVSYTGSFMFGGLMLVVLGLALLISPTLASQSVNGDRERGTLAPLQITNLTSWDLTLGKLVASWGTALVFLLVTTPLAVWCLFEGGLSVGRVVVVYAVMALLMGVVCALALGLSAWTGRTTTSSVLSYLTVFALTAGTAIVFGLLLAVTADTVEDQVTGQTYSYTQSRPDRIWWILAPNPFIVLADAAPETPTTTIRLPDGTLVESRQDADLLGALSQEARLLRQRPEVFIPGNEVPASPAEPGPVWPYGLGFRLVLAAGALLLTERRLRTPAGVLPTGQRVA
ncbi:MAG: ABC transporter permease [Geodermatophilaceae bacterium]|nr:ABC transporter permease [Geodermatophilaceae bacterium]